jgi:hypothetical protein
VSGSPVSGSPVSPGFGAPFPPFPLSDGPYPVGAGEFPPPGAPDILPPVSPAPVAPSADDRDRRRTPVLAGLAAAVLILLMIGAGVFLATNVFNSDNRPTGSVGEAPGDNGGGDSPSAPPSTSGGPSDPTPSTSGPSIGEDPATGNGGNGNDGSGNGNGNGGNGNGNGSGSGSGNGNDGGGIDGDDGVPDFPGGIGDPLPPMPTPPRR